LLAAIAALGVLAQIAFYCGHLSPRPFRPGTRFPMPVRAGMASAGFARRLRPRSPALNSLRHAGTNPLSARRMTMHPSPHDTDLRAPETRRLGVVALYCPASS